MLSTFTLPHTRCGGRLSVGDSVLFAVRLFFYFEWWRVPPQYFYKIMKTPFWVTAFEWAFEKGYFIVPVFLCLKFSYSAFVPAFGTNYSSGQREGILQKYSVKGLIWKTGEGELVLPNFRIKSTENGSSVGNEIFNFSNTQGKDFSQCVGHNVRVYYRQAIHLPYSEGNSNYQVDSIIILN